MRFTFCAAAAVAAISVTPATAAVVDFTNGANGTNGIYEDLVVVNPTFTLTAQAGVYAFDGGIFVPDADGFSLALPIGTIGDLAVRKTNDGLGVGLATPFDPFTDINGAIELITFSFDTPMYFNSVLFSQVDGDDDVDVFIDGALVAPADRPIPGSGTIALGGLTGTSISFGADDLGFFGFGTTDDFKVAQLDVAAVPLPAGVLFGLTGLAGLAAVRRTRR